VIHDFVENNHTVGPDGQRQAQTDERRQKKTKAAKQLHIFFSQQRRLMSRNLGSVLTLRGARIAPNPQRLAGSAFIRLRRDKADMLRVGTTPVFRDSTAEGGRAPLAGFKFKLEHYRNLPPCTL
jgi:hypothetical protein